MSDLGWSRYIAAQEEAHESACYEAARAHGLTVAQADACEDGQHRCAACPWRKPGEPAAAPIQWVTLCKRTDDPKLGWIERTLAARGIPSRRNGESWHAPILEVPAEHEQAGWDLLAEPFDGMNGDQSVDDVEDDHPTFTER